MKFGNKANLWKLAFLGVVFFLLIFSFSLAGCGDPAGDEGGMGTFAISLGGNGRAAVGIDQLRHTITLSGPSGVKTISINGAGTARVSVVAGKWDINVQGFSGDELYSVGSASTEVKAGRTSNVSIQMTVVWTDSAGSPNTGTPSVSPTVSIAIGYLGSSLNMAYPPSDPGFPELSDLKYVVTFTRASDGVVEKTITKDGPATDAIVDAVALGEYNIAMDIFFMEDGSLYASGGAATPTPNPVKINSGTNDITVSVTIDQYAEGDGSSTYPFKVYDVATLQKVGTEPIATGNWSLDANYILMKDINLSSVPSFTPIGDYFTSNNFTGVFDGNNKTISYLTIDISSSGQGLFSAIQGAGAEVKNLTLTGVSIGASLPRSVVGAVAGSNQNGTVSNCHVSGTIDGLDDVGGVVGSNLGAIENCSFITGTVTGTGTSGHVGGIAGYNEGSISDCKFTGLSVSGIDNTGGIVGLNDNSGLVEKCYSTGDITGSGDYAGGIVGSSYGGGIVKNCYSTTGIVYAVTDSGGVVGSNDATVTNCYSTCSITGMFSGGGIVGFNSSTVNNCVALNTNLSISLSSGAGCVVGGGGGGTATNNYARDDMTTPHTPSPGSIADGDDISVAEWGDAGWWTGTALFTDPWWSDKLPPDVP